MSGPLRTAAKIAWREARASAAKFLFVILAVAAGVGSLTGVRGFSRAFQTMLLREARTLLAADLSVRVFALPTPQQTAVMQQLERQGVRRTWVTETVTMLSEERTATPVLVSVKAIDPNVYPFYGAVRLEPPGSLAEKLKPDTVAVSQNLLLRLELRVDDQVRIGGQNFRIAGTVEAEPDRMSGTLNVGPRVMMTREGLDRTGLIIPGSRASERFLFRVTPNGPSIETVRADLKSGFPDAMIIDFRQTHPIIERGLQRATTFLSLVSLIALVVGALGVAMAMQAHLQQRLDSIAIMKCLGARSRQIMRIYAIQTIGLGLTGGLLGILAGSAVQLAFPLLISRYFQLKPGFSWDLPAAGQGLAIGILSTLLFTVPSLLSIRRIRPGLIFRREMAGERPGWRQWWRNTRASIAAALVIVIGIAAIASWLSDSARMGIFFVAALVASLLVLAAIAWLLLRALKWFSRRASGLRPTFRHGIANLYRPGNHAEAALVALGIGVMFTLTVYLVQRGLLGEIAKSAPPGMPNVFLLDITPQKRDEVVNLLLQQTGVEGSPEVVGRVAARIVSIDGVETNKLALRGFSRRYAQTTSVTSFAEKPRDTEILRGAWWDPKQLRPGAEPGLSVSEEAAKILGVTPGSRIEWATPTRRFSAVVAAIHKTESIRLSARVEFIFSPGALNGLPMIYYSGIRVRPQDVPALQRAVYERFPTVTVVNIADVLQIVQEVVDQISVVIRFISAFAILAGAIVLASSVAGTRFRRIREVVILKTLGATRNRVAGIFSVEFLILGLVAGLMGSLLASGFAALLLHRLLNARMNFDPLPNIICIALTTLLAVVIGCLASFRILGQKPLEILRQE